MKLSIYINKFCINIKNWQNRNPKDFQNFLTLLSNVLRPWLRYFKKPWYNQSYLQNFSKLYMDRQLFALFYFWYKIQWSSLILIGNEFQITETKYFFTFENIIQ